MPLFPSRLELPSPDKSSAARADFRELHVLRGFERVEPESVEQGFHHVIKGSDRHKTNHHFLIPLTHSPASQAPTCALFPPTLNPYTVQPPLRLAVAGRIRIFNFEPGHDHGLHLVVLNEIFNVVCSDIFDKLSTWRECRRRVVTRCNRAWPGRTSRCVCALCRSLGVQLDVQVSEIHYCHHK